MRVLFCTTGGLGHLLPLRPLAAELRRRRHEVAWVTAPDALPRLEGPGFELFAAGMTFEASRREFRTSHADAGQLVGERLSAYTFPRLFGAVLGPAMLDDLDRAVRRWKPDFLVHEPAALAAPVVSQSHGLRHVGHGYGLRPPSEYLSAAMACLEPSLRARGLGALVDGGLYRHLYLDIAPGSLQSPLKQADPRVFSFNPYRPAVSLLPALPAALRSALQQSNGRPKIYVTLGTVFNRSPALVAAARAAAQLGGLVVVTTGLDDDLPGLVSIDGQMHVHRFVDQRALLPHCDVVVSHGGAGTLLGAAAHGIPQLILPQAADHFRNARAISAVNAGHPVEPERQSVDAVAKALAGVLGSGTLSAGAKKLAQEMASMPDAASAASALERWAGTRSTVVQ
jgi:UDP:flavonoid glycosyltransferase YjiC (YdhE family)